MPTLTHVRSARVQAVVRFLPLAVAIAIPAIFHDVFSPSDLEVFLRAGDQVAHGINPFTPVNDAYLYSGHAYVYPWLTAFFFVPLALLPSLVAFVIFYLLSTSALIVGCRWLGLQSPIGISAVLLAAPVVRNAELGAVNAIFFIAAAAAWRWRDRTRVVAPMMVVLVGMKLFLAPMLLWVALTRSRFCAVVTGAAVAAYFGVSFLLGPVNAPHYARAMSVLSEHESLRSMSLRHLSSLLLPPGLVPVIPVMAFVAMLMLVVLRRDDRARFIGCLLAGLVLTPIFWTHYIVLVLFAVLMLRPTTTWAVGAAVLSWVISAPRDRVTLGNLSVEHRLLLLYAIVFAIAVAVASGRTSRADAAPSAVAPARPG